MKRFLFSEIEDHLNHKQITLLLGARQVGKTTLLRQIYSLHKNNGEFVFFLSLEDPDILSTLNASPKNLFKVIPPLSDKRMILFIDEIQYLDNPSNFLKYHYDLYQSKLKFVVTGSSSFYIDRKFTDSLAGRKRIFELPTLSLAEIFHFKQRDELVPYLNKGSVPVIYRDEIRSIFYEYLLYGGYPEVVLEKSLKDKTELLKELRDSYAKKDAVEANLRNLDAYLHLMKLIAFQTGSLLNKHSLSQDTAIDNKSIDDYLTVMRKSFHIHLLRPFYSNISSELRKMPKLYFADLGLRNSLVNDFRPIGIREDKGSLLENYVYLLLRRKFSEEYIHFWRTQKKHEVDFIVQKDDGSSSAFEVKYNESRFRVSKYSTFTSAYPATPLECIDIDTCLEYDLHGIS
ncbi:MAG: ATP-binding protein [Spirochaetales bacterium]|nr:ATP-binding protein [Spirochaetales bacterium]